MMKQTAYRIPFVYKLLAGLILLICMFVISMVVGAADTSFRDVWLALTTDARGDTLSLLREIRLPREIAALFVGSALAVSGAIMQGMTRNPLADPGLLGLTAGANAALAISLVWIPSANYFSLTLIGFVGAAVGALLVFGISSLKRGGFSPFRIVLAGAAVSAFLHAIAEGIGIRFKVAKEISLWTAGGLMGTSWSQVQVLVPFVLCGILLALGLSRQLTILSLNEEAAIGLGQRVMTIKSILFAVTTLLAGASVALVGNIAFLGLMVPHIVRAMVGTDYRRIIPLSIIMGGIFMLFADTLGRTISAPYETPVAAIIAMMGIPFFLLIVKKGGRGLS
jgi:iron complex transport system permease protein